MFSSVMRRLRRSTLFPYTTLFRSYVTVRGLSLAIFQVQTATARGAAEDLAHLRNEIADIYARVDRKSTRLNSSHPVKSYAVFCLKKKRRNNRHREPDRRSDE